MIMKKLILCLIIIALPLFAEEMWLGLVTGAEADSLILVDGKKVHVPSLQSARYITDNNEQNMMTSVRPPYPYTATLIIPEASKALSSEEREVTRKIPTIKIHDFYEVVNGRLKKRTTFE
jgi:hypothetical protein